MNTTLQAQLLAPIEWQCRSASADSAAAAIRVLQTAAALGEKPPVISEDAIGLELEVARLQQKTQLLIELLAVALGRQSTRPEPQLLSFGSESCEWLNAENPGLGAEGMLVIWLHPAAPEPLEWPAEIVEATPGPTGYQLNARLYALGAPAQVALERHIFLLHRRAVAEAKAHRS